MTPIFKKTAKQIEANALLQSDARHILLRGGSRSGKTFILVRALILRMLKEYSRHLILRKHFNHVKQAIWLDTLPNVMEMCFPGLTAMTKFDKSDWYVTLPNKSELWFGGLDDKQRVDKILGKEYSTIYYNECSEMSFDAVGIAQTRLSQKNGLVKRFYYDCNPPKETHWSNKLFIKKVNPLNDNDEPLPNPEDYATMLINPRDNAVNLDPDYITKTLERLPPALRLRFLYGLYGSDDHDIIQPDWIIPSTDLDKAEIMMKVSFCDPAYTDKSRATDNTCESSIVTVGVDREGIIHELEALHGFWSYEQLKINCKSVYERHSKTAHYIFGVEDVAAQRWLSEDLEKLEIFTVLIKPDGDKIRRTISITDLMEQKRCRINNLILSNQLLGFPGERLKDLVDSYVGCLKLVKMACPDKFDKAENKFEGLDGRSILFWKAHQEQKEEGKKVSLGDFYRGML